MNPPQHSPTELQISYCILVSSFMGSDTVSMGKEFCWFAWPWRWRNNDSLEHLKPLTQHVTSQQTWTHSITVLACHSLLFNYCKNHNTFKKLLGINWVLYFSLQHLIYPQLRSQWLHKHIVIFYERCLLLLSIKIGVYRQILAHLPHRQCYMPTCKWSESNRHYFWNIWLQK